MAPPCAGVEALLPDPDPQGTHCAGGCEAPLVLYGRCLEDTVGAGRAQCVGPMAQAEECGRPGCWRLPYISSLRQASAMSTRLRVKPCSPWLPRLGTRGSRRRQAGEAVQHESCRKEWGSMRYACPLLCLLLHGHLGTWMDGAQCCPAMVSREQGCQTQATRQPPACFMLRWCWLHAGAGEL